MVVMEHTESVHVSQCGDQQINRRKAMMPSPCELSLALERFSLHHVVKGHPGQREHPPEQRLMVGGER